MADAFMKRNVRSRGSAFAFAKHATKYARGLTIVQLMVVLLIAGLIGSFVVDYIIGKRCGTDQTSTLCADRKAASKK